MHYILLQNYFNMKVDLSAVVAMASTASIIRCRAESVPMVMSVPQKSLSMEPTIPTMFRCLYFSLSSWLILPEADEIDAVLPIEAFSCKKWYFMNKFR